MGKTDDQLQRGWFVVLVLVAAYAVSMLDRQIISLLVASLKQGMGLTDTQIGLLQGPAFGVFYALLGLPLGWMADRVHRVRFIACAIALWSAMTVASGFATDFTMLLVYRCGVGIGQAALVPAAVSLIADLFTSEKRAMPLSVFTAGVSLGAGLSLLLGGAFIAYANGGVADLPLIGAWLAAKQSWQVVFILAGMLGFPVAAILLFAQEPSRSSLAGVPAKAGSFAGNLAYLRQNKHFFAPFWTATCSLYILGGAVGAWYPSLLVRKFAWSANEVGYALGIAIMVCAVLGNLCSGALATYRQRIKVSNPTVSTMATGALLMIPVSIIAPLLPTGIAVLFGMGALYFVMSLTFGVATAALAAHTAGAYRGQVVAIHLLIGNLVGMGLGPTSIGAMMDYGGIHLQDLATSLALLCAVVTLPALFLLRRVARMPTTVLA